MTEWHSVLWRHYLVTCWTFSSCSTQRQFLPRSCLPCKPRTGSIIGKVPEVETKLQTDGLLHQLLPQSHRLSLTSASWRHTSTSFSKLRFQIKTLWCVFDPEIQRFKSRLGSARWEEKSQRKHSMMLFIASFMGKTGLFSQQEIRIKASRSLQFTRGRNLGTLFIKTLKE